LKKAQKRRPDSQGGERRLVPRIGPQTTQVLTGGVAENKKSNEQSLIVSADHRDVGGSPRLEKKGLRTSVIGLMPKRGGSKEKKRATH